jgi:hypothetical protein
MSDLVGIPVQVTVDENHLADLASLDAALTEVGLQNQQVLGVLGIVTGTVSDENILERLKQVPGVIAVERSLDFQLPFPDEQIQ